jgi:hypothetical protein
VHDPPQHAGVLLERVGIERRHDAARAAVANSDQHAAGAQPAPGPVELLEGRRAAYHHVRPEAPVVDADGTGHARGEHREREDVMALTAIPAVEAHQLDARTCRDADQLARTCGIPPQTLHLRLAVGAERSLQAEQSRTEA